MQIEDAVKILDTLVPNPECGLPEDIFVLVSKLTPLVNVDLLIKDNQGRTLLTWRDDIWYGSGWHVPGGIVRFKETFEQRIHAVAKGELGATVMAERLPRSINQLINGSSNDRGHFISLLFSCTLISSPDEGKRANLANLQAGQWEWHEYPPRNLIAVHNIYRHFL